MKIELVGLCARMVMPFASTSADADIGIGAGGCGAVPYSAENGGPGMMGIPPPMGTCWAWIPSAGIPRIPCRVRAISSGSA